MHAGESFPSFFVPIVVVIMVATVVSVVVVMVNVVVFVVSVIVFIDVVFVNVGCSLKGSTASMIA